MNAPATGPAPAAIGQAQGENPAPAMTATPAPVDAPGQAQGETPAAPLAAIDPAKGAAPRHPHPRLAPMLLTLAHAGSFIVRTIIIAGNGPKKSKVAGYRGHAAGIGRDFARADESAQVCTQRGFCASGRSPTVNGQSTT